MTNSLTQLKIAYETNGMSPEEISIDQGLDINAVKAGLMQCSSKYRRDCGAEDENESKLNFSEQDLVDINEVILHTAKYAEDERLRFQAATYIRDDKKGRKDVVKHMQNNTFNLLQFNQQLNSVKQLASEAKEKLLSPSPA